MNAGAASEDRSASEESSPGHDLRGDAIDSTTGSCQLDRYHREQRGANGDENLRAQSSRLVPKLSLESQGGAESGTTSSRTVSSASGMSRVSKSQTTLRTKTPRRSGGKWRRRASLLNHQILA